jgi:hypothetical protein
MNDDTDIEIGVIAAALLIAGLLYFGGWLH